MITLNEVTKNNWIDVISLTVREDQREFIATNAVSLAQLHFLENFVARAIYDDQQLVGFALYGVDEDDREYWIYRFMIDQKFQGNHLGRAAMTAIIEDIRERKEPRHTTITLSYEPRNQGAKQFYDKVGFQEVDGLLISDEQVSRYML